MHIKKINKKTKTKQWRMLLVYNIYRFVNISVLFGVYWLATYHQASNLQYFGALFAYFIFGVVFLYFWYARTLKFEQQVLYSGTVDIIAMVLFIDALGYIDSGLGILLNASIAVLSILAPGRLAIFFAAIASCMFLGISSIQYMKGVHEDLSSFFSTGIYGAGFFATALTAWYLARLVYSSENLARNRGKELASMQRLNEYIVERLQYGVILVDANQVIKVINSAARQFLYADIIAPDLQLQQLSSPLYERYLRFLAKNQKDEQSAQTTIKIPFLHVQFFSTSLGAETAVLIILDDMTNISQQAQQLKLASLGRFSASIAHELRNPLGIIAHAVQLLGEEDALNNEDNRLKQLIINNCNRMNNVIKNVLQMSRRQQSKPEAIDLKDFLQQFKADFCVIDQGDIILNLPKTRLNTVIFDRSQLEQILVILWENSLQHGKNGTGKVMFTISIKNEAHKISLLLSDSGAGIAEEIRNNIFDPFFSTLRTGNGMGLFIAKDLCEINQGHLNLVDSDQGCCFSITLNQNDEIS